MDSFNNELNEFLKSEIDINYSLFENIFLQILNALRPVKKKTQKFNNNIFMRTQLHKAIMHRSELKKVFNKLANVKHGIAIKNSAIFA